MRCRQLAPLALAAVMGSGCATDMELLTPDGKPLASAPPAPYRIAVLPVANCEQLVDALPHGLRFTIAPDALHAQLVARMNSLRAATEVFASATQEQAEASGADLILASRLVGAPRIEHVSVSQYWWASGLLWITTWIGGLLVPDSTYEARIAVDCDFRNAARDSDEVIGLAAASGQTDLNFWDRNTFLTGGFFLSLVLPPFWTSDDTAVTSASLSTRALDQVAGRIASFLKFELAEREKDSYGQVVFAEPENGATVGSTTRVAGVVSGRWPITEITVMVNDEPVQLATRIREPVNQQIGTGRFGEQFATVDIALRVGPNSIVVRTTLATHGSGSSLVSTRTLAVIGTAPEADTGTQQLP